MAARAKATTGKKVTQAAVAVLRDKKASKGARSAAASALTQTSGRKDRASGEVTSKAVASAASRVLRDPKASKAEKKVAASALSQRRKNAR